MASCDQIEAEIDEDAAAAAPSSVPGEEAPGQGGRSLSAVPPLEDSGPPTEAWHSEPMDLFSPGSDTDAGLRQDLGPHFFGSTGSDWIA